MSNNNDLGSLGIKPPKRRNVGLLTADKWLDDKRELEDVGGLWRVHDGIYDLTDFVEAHPGGSQWLELSKGTDITEAFEVHHLNNRAQEVLKKYYVKEATTKRNSPFTFEDDGFYRTLKREVVRELEKVPIKEQWHSSVMTDLFVVATFVLSIISVKIWSFGLAMISGYFLCITAIAAHNFMHKKDNFRMYYHSLSLMQVREWRISHVLSHHLYTNTVADFDIANLEPMFQYLPTKKNTRFEQYAALFYTPFFWCIGWHDELLRRCRQLYRGETQHLGWSEIIPFILPATMYLLGGESFISTLCMWTFIICSGSFTFHLIGMNAGHYHPDIFHDGDTPRSTSIDWGVGQLDSVMDRKDVTGNSYLVLTMFGDHCLHHMFPTLDHAILSYLYPVFNKVMKQFDLDLRMTSQLTLIKGQFQQLLRHKPNPNPPNLLKQYN